MVLVSIDYATPSAFESTRDRALLALTSNAKRPVRFHGRVRRNAFLVRLALRTLGEIIWADDTWQSDGFMLDPVITVHPDRIFFEAFSRDESAYAMIILNMSLFEAEGETVCGTTNIDFTAWLWAALAELRSSRDTMLRIEPEGFEVVTAGAGGRFEQKVELPDHWVRGFLQLQEAMSVPGTCITCRPVDLLSAIRFLRYSKAKVSPRALRYEFEPGSDVRIMLEPWEHSVTLKGAEHHYAATRVIRTWGRRRLSMIEPLLPFADRVDIYLKGRALPSFYAVTMKDITVMLGLSGWSGQRWTETGSFDLSSPAAPVDEEKAAAALSLLSNRYHLSLPEISESLAVTAAESAALMSRLCRRGKVIFDIQSRLYRHRELFEETPDEAVLFPPDIRQEKAEKMLAAGDVTVHQCTPQETRKTKAFMTLQGRAMREVIYRDWHVTGSAGEEKKVEIVLNDTLKLIFGTCGCHFFRDNLLNKGPCEHMVALIRAAEDQMKDLPTSQQAAAELDRADREPSEGEEAEDGEDEE